MKLFKRKKRSAGSKIGTCLESVLRPLMNRAGTRLRLAQRIRLLNSKASRHPKRTFALVFSVLLLIFMSDLSMTLLLPAKATPQRIDIASVDTVFSGFRTIQDNKEIHKKQLTDMALAGNIIRLRLDSLISLPHKTKADSIEIRVNHMKLERIVNTLKAYE